MEYSQELFGHVSFLFSDRFMRLYGNTKSNLFQEAKMNFLSQGDEGRCVFTKYTLTTSEISMLLEAHSGKPFKSVNMSNYCDTLKTTLVMHGNSEEQQELLNF